MTEFTRFGVWDIEVRSFITKITKRESLRANAQGILDWFYSTGFREFMKEQKVVNDAFTQQEISKKGEPPHVSELHMEAQKTRGFRKVRDAFVKTF